jgi:hypothetical protein
LLGQPCKARLQACRRQLLPFLKVSPAARIAAFDTDAPAAQSLAHHIVKQCRLLAQLGRDGTAKFQIELVDL